MPQFPQRFRFDLADALAGHAKFLSHFFQRPRAPILQPKAQFQHFALAVAQTFQHILHLFFQQLRVMPGLPDPGTDSSSIKSPSEELSSLPMGISSDMGSCAIFKMRRILAAARLSLRSRSGSMDFVCGAHFENGRAFFGRENFHLERDFFRIGFASEFLLQTARDAQAGG